MYTFIKIDINEIKLKWAAAAILRLIKLFRNYIVHTPAVPGRPQRKTTEQKLIKRLSAEKRKLTFGRFSRMTTPLVQGRRGFDKSSVRIVYTLRWLWFLLHVSVFVYWNDYNIFYNIPRSILRVQLCQCIYIIMQPHPYIYTDYIRLCLSLWLKWF